MYGSWPASGEIDIVESRGNQNYSYGGSNQFGTTLHWGPFYPLDMWSLTHETYTLSEGDFADDFHVFGLVWNDTIMYSYIDDPENMVLKLPITESFWNFGDFLDVYNNPWQGRGPNAPFDQTFYLIFNVAVGGTNGYFPDSSDKPWSNESPNAVDEFYQAIDQWYPTWNGEQAAMQIDWVRVTSD